MIATASRTATARAFALVFLSCFFTAFKPVGGMPAPDRAYHHRRVLAERDGSGRDGGVVERRGAEERREWSPEGGDGYWNAVKAIMQAATATPSTSTSTTSTSASVETGVVENLAIGSSSVITDIITSIVYQTITRTHDSAFSSVANSSTTKSGSSGITLTMADSSMQLLATTSTLSATASTALSIVTPTSTATPSNTMTSSPATFTASPAASTSGKMVFAHFMVGIVEPYVVIDWETDMRLALSYGIDGFALNVGTDPYTDEQLGYAYTAAANVGFQVFISFDFSYYNTGMVSQISSLISKYVVQSAQFKVNGASYVSTFIGDGFPWNTVATTTGQNLYVVPNWQGGSAGDFTSSGISGLFSWLAWPSSDNAPIDTLMSVVGPTYDQEYLAVTKPAGKTFMAPVSPWFSTHFASKNYAFLSETLWYDRWTAILAEQSDLEYLEIISWNDFGESHYVGDYNTPHTDDGSSHWAAGMPHTPLLDFAKPYINAFKSGASTPVVTEDMLIYWYRPTLKEVSCDGTDTVASKPTGYDMMSDTVFVVAFATSPGQVTVTSGSNAPFQQAVQSGVTMIQVPMAVGTQAFSMTTVLGADLTASGGLQVTNTCWNGTEYNYNIYTGSISA